MVIKLLAEWLSSRLERHCITFVESERRFLIHDRTSTANLYAYGDILGNSVRVASLKAGLSDFDSAGLSKFDLADPDCFDGVLRFINALPDH